MAYVGYARVSTVDQETRLQRDALARAGVVRVHEEKASAVARRPELERCLLSLRRGDTLVVWKLDRLARSLRDLLTLLERLHSVGAGIRSLTEPIDTGSPAGVLMLQVLGAVAQFERTIIRERVVAGQRAARARGQRWGRPRALAAEVEEEIVWKYVLGDGAYTHQSLAREHRTSHQVVRAAIYRVTRPDAPYLTRRR
ncbi:recombinase family protein [Ramlibacter humi]|uniref:Recombinase family protein n=1 Tax=Ramlibacter humi TaxID=2530451 RepID=A0A4Z0BKS4_9BURK|nr:recombinase family protein [Ramlibacter humi]TFY99009.1 recombinase family protein [Ramlibacter humi]